MTIHTHRRSLAAGVLLMSLALLATSVPVSAKVRTGSCTGSTDWEMEVYLEDGRIESEFEIDHSRSAATWHWTMKNDGSRFASGQATVRSGRDSFVVNRFSTNGAGPDTIVSRAINRATGEVCSGSITL
jgi:hypothetical protein